MPCAYVRTYIRLCLCCCCTSEIRVVVEMITSDPDLFRAATEESRIDCRVVHPCTDSAMEESWLIYCHALFFTFLSTDATSRRACQMRLEYFWYSQLVLYQEMCLYHSNRTGIHSAVSRLMMKDQQYVAIHFTGSGPRSTTQLCITRAIARAGKSRALVWHIKLKVIQTKPFIS